ncbi:hypothetical protein JRQ81_011398 [Phrynocephalus forsythii]|uniref:G-protein coupled receptors family 1 profile domain-containing protein n=1 Tax=Phrynocephalus forsythii TaxID=171643 RepID=A0A9Q0X653_9SAUR|nr:hypothetical protein JRQ81_011398 [Phrynocephalus forsythii]
MDASGNSSPGLQCFQTPNETYSSLLDIPYFLCESLTALLSIVGNLFICAVILLNRKLRLATANYFLVSLAVADFFVGAVVIPCAQITDIGLPRYRPQLCLLMLCTLLVFTQASVFSLLAVAVERYISILKPFQYKALMSPRHALFIILACWLLAFASGILPLLGWHGPFPASGECVFKSIIQDAYMVYFSFIACMLVPLSVMMVLYGRIFLEVRRQIRKVAEGEVDLSAQERRRIIIRKELHTATSLFLLLFFFTVCWLPVHILNIVALVCPSCCIPNLFGLTTVILSHANSAINPVVYVFRMRSFRKAFEGALARLCYSSAVGTHAGSEIMPSTIVEEPPLRNTPLPGK